MQLPLSMSCAFACQAAELPKDSVDRLLKVAAYALTPYAAARRAKKPLFCVPGETFEAVYPTKGVRYISEAVRHIPNSHSHMQIFHFSTGFTHSKLPEQAVWPSQISLPHVHGDLYMNLC